MLNFLKRWRKRREAARDRKELLRKSILIVLAQRRRQPIVGCHAPGPGDEKSGLMAGRFLRKEINLRYGCEVDVPEFYDTLNELVEDGLVLLNWRPKLIREEDFRQRFFKLP